MADADSDEVSTGELVAAATTAGYTITVATLKRWHRQGIIPSPRIIRLGRGRGTASVYPAGTIDQLVDALAAHSADRRLDRVRWRLWWQGYPIPTKWIRGYAQRVLEPADRQLADFRALTDDQQLDVIEAAAARSTQLPSTLRQAHKRSRDGFVTVLRIFGDIAVGRFAETDDEEAPILYKALRSRRDDQHQAGRSRCAGTQVRV